ncbi:unnamed protein product [Acanthoscelides obtectus]|uniref:Uncharacterized protein n=1 Tax=Acanthoscelides obtectus TaxID=200917 RepID=A0A9P0KMG3_ACAOB|nr:unnamed protein product [Acanthoscelides obtectus]CAK1685433.1 hypothetical protein AOBTE_LOCUS35394 [Acanthoscelides obtectus]
MSIQLIFNQVVSCAGSELKFPIAPPDKVSGDIILKRLSVISLIRTILGIRALKFSASASDLFDCVRFSHQIDLFYDYYVFLWFMVVDQTDRLTNVLMTIMSSHFFQSRLHYEDAVFGIQKSLDNRYVYGKQGQELSPMVSRNLSPDSLVSQHLEKNASQLWYPIQC